MARMRNDAGVVPAVSGEQCARALERLGLTRCSEQPGVSWMLHGSRFVAVPMCNVLPAETLLDLLEGIGIAVRDLVAQLGAQPARARMEH
jgi:hypothetical protein